MKPTTKTYAIFLLSATYSLSAIAQSSDAKQPSAACKRLYVGKVVEFRKGEQAICDNTARAIVVGIGERDSDSGLTPVTVRWESVCYVDNSRFRAGELYEFYNCSLGGANK